jgi:hypothetical protein
MDSPMMVFEILAPPGTLDADRQRRIAGTLRSELANPQRMSPGADAVFGSLFHLIVHEPAGWLVDERPAADHYLVRVSVPGPWRKDVSRPVIAAVTSALTDVHPGDRPPQELVQVTGVAEGGLGVAGVPATSADIVELMNRPHHDDLAAGRALLDPMCGVLVPLNDDTVTLERDGTLLGFCCTGCRDGYLDRRRRAAERG